MVFLILLLVFCLPVTARGEVIDLHAHTAGIGAGGSGNFISKKLRNNFRFPLYMRAFGVSEEEAQQNGDQFIVRKISERLAQSKEVNKIVLLAIDGVIDDEGNLDRENTEYYIDNDFLAAEVKKYPNLLFAASVNPKRKDALARLEAAKTNGAVMIKWLPSIQLFSPDDPAFIPFYNKLVELKLPLLTHTGDELSFTHAQDELTDPERLRLPLSLGVRVIAAHMGLPGKNHGEENFVRLVRLMKEYPNLYGDISSLNQINKRFAIDRVLREPGLKGRIAFGTDFPLSATALISPYYYVFRLKWSQIREIAKVDNPWDRTVLIYRALGVPEEVFQLPGELIK